jgi:DNA-binding CsgD family transcriptional regulator/tetratricopeptide (TPR) repeat protein
MSRWSPPPLPSRFAASRHIPIVGRQAELTCFEEMWAATERGERQAVFIGGEPGAGKTRLALEVAAVLRENGATVLVGTSGADFDLPYRPFAEMLDHLFLTTPVGVLTPFLGDTGLELARLSEQVRRHLETADRTEPPGELRQDLFDATARFFRALAAERPLVLVLDDLHWAQAPTLALLSHVTRATADARLLLVGTFRTTAPDRSPELADTIADLYRLEGIRRLDLTGLDTESIAEYLHIQGRVPLAVARGPAAMLRDQTGGNPFFLRELWRDLQQRGGVATLRTGTSRVPASISDTLEHRLSGLGDLALRAVELAAVLGDSFDLSTLAAASDAERSHVLAAVDAAVAVDLVEPTPGSDGVYAFVHSLSRQTVLERMAPSRRTLLHARAAEALERHRDDASVIPRLAQHYLAAHFLGYEEQAIRYATEAGRLAERCLAYEEAASWFERVAALPEVAPEARAGALFDAAANHLRAGDFARARSLYERLTVADDASIRLRAALGYEDANWRPGLADPRAADLLTSALASADVGPSDARYVHALASLGRALAFAGDAVRAREVGTRAIDLARGLGDGPTLAHALKTSLWRGITPDMTDIQWQRSQELSRMAGEAGDFETLGAAGYFRAMVSYTTGRPEELETAMADVRRAGQSTGQPFYAYLAGCLTQGQRFARGDFDDAERWAHRMVEMGDSFGRDDTEGSFGVQMFMLRRETGGLAAVARHVSGDETLDGRWVPGLLALYTELHLGSGIARTLRHLLDRDLEAQSTAAQWPAELVFMVEGALALGDADAAAALQPFLARYDGMNLVAGQFVALFGSANRYLGRIASLNGDNEVADAHFGTALRMDERMRSTVHMAETLAHRAVHRCRTGDTQGGLALAQQARALSEPIGQVRVLRLLDTLQAGGRPDGLTSREVDVLRLLAEGLSNKEIGERLYISTNTAANHVRSILMKIGATNRTGAAMYAREHDLVPQPSVRLGASPRRDGSGRPVP